MSRTVDNVLWMMLSMLLQVFLDASNDLPIGGNKGEEHDSIVILPSVQALLCLESLLQSLQDVVPEFYYRKSFVVIARVSLALYEYATHAKTANEGQGDDIVHNSDSRYRRSRAWCQAGLQVLCHLLVRVRGTELSERLQTIQTSSQENVEGDIHTLFMDSSDQLRR